MTSIDKLSIQGIRSFSPTQSSTIEFFKPLTIIVGENGAGKTVLVILRATHAACLRRFLPCS
jgi:DNA repair protein RAD50